MTPDLPLKPGSMQQLRLMHFIQLLVLSVAFLATSQAVQASSKDIAKWEVVDLVFEAAPGDAPFDLELEASFISPSGRQLQVPGFHDGGNRFVIRFSAGEAGTWTWKTTSSSSDLAGSQFYLPFGQAVASSRVP